MVKHILLLCFLSLCTVSTAMAEEVNQNLWTTGKIHVVVAVLITIFIGIIIFLIALERKIKKLERDM